MPTLTYHYCTMHIRDGMTAYNDGVVEVSEPVGIGTLKDLRVQLRDRLGLPDTFTILSLTRL